MALSSIDPHLLALATALGLFALLWPISVARRDASVVDAAWGPGFAIIAWLIWALAGQPADERSLILLGLISLWAARLAVYMIGRKLREPEEDPRYGKLRASWDPGFWWKSLFVVFLLQGTLQWLLVMPAQRALLNSTEAFGAVSALGVALAVAGLAFETIADAQLDRFRRQNPRPALCTSGLWAWSRHPNYLGEMAFWWGVWLIAVPSAELWTIVAPILLTLLLRYVSGVPMLERHLAETRPEFDAYRSRTPMLAPWPLARKKERAAAR
ncbi:MAG: DUF1295 domain-containing protein [Pseudomonadota bacterium]